MDSGLAYYAKMCIPRLPLWNFFHSEKIISLQNPFKSSHNNKFAVQEKYQNRFWALLRENIMVLMRDRPKIRHIIAEIQLKMRRSKIEMMIF